MCGMYSLIYNLEIYKKCRAVNNRESFNKYAKFYVSTQNIHCGIAYLAGKLLKPRKAARL